MSPMHVDRPGHTGLTPLSAGSTPAPALPVAGAEEAAPTLAGDTAPAATGFRLGAPPATLPSLAQVAAVANKHGGAHVGNRIDQVIGGLPGVDPAALRAEAERRALADVAAGAAGDVAALTAAYRLQLASEALAAGVRSGTISGSAALEAGAALLATGRALTRDVPALAAIVDVAMISLTALMLQLLTWLAEESKREDQRRAKANEKKLLADQEVRRMAALRQAAEALDLKAQVVPKTRAAAYAAQLVKALARKEGTGSVPVPALRAEEAIAADVDLLGALKAVETLRRQPPANGRRRAQG